MRKIYFLIFCCLAVGNNNLTVGGNWDNAGQITASKCRIAMNGAGIHGMTGNL